MQKGVDGGGQDRRSPGRDCRSHPKRTVRKPRRSGDSTVTAAHNQCWREIMGGITKHGSAKRSIKILERDKEQTLKTLSQWKEEKLDDFFPRQELVDEMHKLHEEHGEAKRKAREDSDMGDAGETAKEDKEFSEEEAIWARKLDGAAIDKENKYCMFWSSNAPLIKEKSTKKEQGCGQKSSMRI